MTSDEKSVRGVFNTQTGKIEYQDVDAKVAFGSISCFVWHSDKQRKAALAYLKSRKPKPPQAPSDNPGYTGLTR